jgi:hypothetical protein
MKMFMNIALPTASPVVLQQMRLQLLHAVKQIDNELESRIQGIVTNIDEHRARATHYATIGKAPY